MDLSITPWEGGLGDEIVLPTPGGKVDLKVLLNARSGQKLPLKGKDIPGQPPNREPEGEHRRGAQMFKTMAKDMPFDPNENLRRYGK